LAQKSRSAPVNQGGFLDSLINVLVLLSSCLVRLLQFLVLDRRDDRLALALPERIEVFADKAEKLIPGKSFLLFFGDLFLNFRFVFGCLDGGNNLRLFSRNRDLFL
jgi:hypothetical protein